MVPSDGGNLFSDRSSSIYWLFLIGLANDKVFAGENGIGTQYGTYRYIEYRMGEVSYVDLLISDYSITNAHKNGHPKPSCSIGSTGDGSFEFFRALYPLQTMGDVVVRKQDLSQKCGAGTHLGLETLFSIRELFFVALGKIALKIDPNCFCWRIANIFNSCLSYYSKSIFGKGGSSNKFSIIECDPCSPHGDEILTVNLISLSGGIGGDLGVPHTFSHIDQLPNKQRGLNTSDYSQDARKENNPIMRQPVPAKG